MIVYVENLKSPPPPPPPGTTKMLELVNDCSKVTTGLLAWPQSRAPTTPDVDKDVQ